MNFISIGQPKRSKENGLRKVSQSTERETFAKEVPAFVLRKEICFSAEPENLSSIVHLSSSLRSLHGKFDRYILQ